MRKNTLTRREFLEKASAGLAAASALPAGVTAAAVSKNPNALALKGGTPVRTRPFPHWPQTNDVDERNILKALRNHRWCSFDGEFMPKFEKAWAEEVGAGGCVMTPCGTHALHMSLNLLGVGPGDEVVVAPFTYIATIDVILMCYALPVFADTDPRTFQIDPDDIERRITEHTRAILPVHISGAPAHMDKILHIGSNHNLPVIEDACQAHTAEWRGKRVGTLGAMGCFSFQESKVLPAGEAGALVSDNQKLIDQAYIFRNFGSDPKQDGRYVVRGTKYRQSDFAAAILMAQLTHFREVCARREKHGAYLKEELGKIPGIYPQQTYSACTRQTYLDIVFRYDEAHFHGVSREKLIEALRAEGIDAGIPYPALNREPFIEHTLASRAYRTVFSKARLDRYRERNHCPHNDEVCATSLYLNQHVLIGEKSDVDDIVEAFAKVQKNAGTL
jgi:dTDP-4-amino-4,6-dideoxygalactose transaminase